MKLSHRWKSYRIGQNFIEMRRLKGGLVEIHAENPLDLQRGLGFAHALDRLMQMLVTRIIGRGELSRYFLDSDEGFEIDLIGRKLGFRHDVVRDLHKLTKEASEWTQAYCDGINAFLEKDGPPLFCKLFKVKTESWHITDAMLIVKTLSYLGIAQQQERIERLIIHALRSGVSKEKLQVLFSPYLEKLDEKELSLIKNLNVTLSFFDTYMRFQPFKAPFSNNWVIAPHKSKTNSPLLCVDPHLQVNRLPATWYEAVGSYKDGENYQMGITLPGFPGWIMGRSKHISTSFTYGMLDTVDFFIEEIKNGSYRRGDIWIPLNLRVEHIHRKKKGEVCAYFYESDAGVIERKDFQNPSIEDGYYLCLAWSGYRSGPSTILNCLMHLWESKSVEEAQMYLWSMPLPCNWVIADKAGNIGFQQSGQIPIRRSSGLLPLPAWEKENLWQGFYLGTELEAEMNPKKGYLASANDDKNQPDMPPFTTFYLADYRYRRICDLLSQDKKFSVDDMKEMQRDVYSIQAEEFMRQIRDMLPETKNGRILKEWDFCYGKDSKAATLFEAFYRNVLFEVFAPVFGKQAWDIYGPGHIFFGQTFGNFDRVLLSGDPSWFGKEGKDALFQRVLKSTLDNFDQKYVPKWGNVRHFFMNYLLFDGKLPKFLGFDIGPIVLNGSRATLDTFQIFKERKRKIVTSATYRFITDMGEDQIHSVLAGGPSEKRRSKWYVSDIEAWRKYKYKTIYFDTKSNSFDSYSL